MGTGLTLLKYHHRFKQSTINHHNNLHFQTFMVWHISGKSGAIYIDHKAFIAA